MSTEKADPNQAIDGFSSNKRNLIRKQTSYYLLLEETTCLGGDYSIGKSSDIFNTLPDNTYLQENDINRYEDAEVREVRTNQQKGIMKKQLQDIKASQNVDPTLDTYQKSIEGYPSWLRDNEEAEVKYGLKKISDFREDVTGILENIADRKASDEDLENCDIAFLKLMNYKVCQNPAEKKVLQYHNDKTKEIRRLQYSELQQQKLRDGMAKSAAK